MTSTPEILPAYAWLAAIVESSIVPIISNDLTGVITSWNRAAQDLFGYTAEESVGQPVTILIPPDRVDEEPGILERIGRGERIDHYETIRRRKDGTLLEVSLTVSPIYGPDGRVIGASKIARDVSRRKRSEIELSRLASIVDSSADAIISKDLNGIITSWNAGAEMVFGYTADEVIGKPVTILMPPDRVDEEPGILQRIRRGERVKHYETIRQRKDGRLIDISLNVSPVYDESGTIVGASKIARDVTEHKNVERTISEKENARKLLDAQESERARISRDLHDHLGQQMTAFRFKLESLSGKCGENPELQKDIDELRQAALKIDRDIGFLSWELRPTELDSLGLKDALASFISEWSNQHDIVANFHADIAGSMQGHELTDVVEINLYRIVQECLNNIRKHSKAAEVNVLFHLNSQEAVLIVEDNGQGFNTSSASIKASAPSGLGLLSMRERASLLHGTVDIESVPGRGTTILIRVPLTEALAKGN